MSYEEEKKNYIDNVGVGNFPHVLRNMASNYERMIPDFKRDCDILRYIADHMESEQRRLTVKVDVKLEETLKMMLQNPYPEIIGTILERIKHADTKHADDPMSKDDIPAAFGTIYNEISELRREVERKKPRPNAMRQEAIDAAAALFKFIRDICTTDWNKIDGQDDRPWSDITK